MNESPAAPARGARDSNNKRKTDTFLMIRSHLPRRLLRRAWARSPLAGAGVQVHNSQGPGPSKDPDSLLMMVPAYGQAPIPAVSARPDQARLPAKAAGGEPQAAGARRHAGAGERGPLQPRAGLRPQGLPQYRYPGLRSPGGGGLPGGLSPSRPLRERTAERAEPRRRRSARLETVPLP